MSLNKAMIIGNLGRDPEMRYTPSGQAVTQFTVAVNRSWRDPKDPNGEWKEETEWHNIVAFEKLAEICAEHLRKGAKVYVEGRLKTEKWEKDGQERKATKIYAQAVQFLSAKSGEKAGAADAAEPDNADDVPF